MDEITELLQIVDKLHTKYPHRDFSLDGRLVGDIGEIIAESNYEITLYPSGKKTYDGFSGDKQIQIKTTFTDSLTFPVDIPDYYLGIKVFSDGTHEEIYNGPGNHIGELVKNRKQPANGQYQVSISALKALNLTVAGKDKIKQKKK
jgi:hypothetical protein